MSRTVSGDRSAPICIGPVCQPVRASGRASWPDQARSRRARPPDRASRSRRSGRPNVATSRPARKASAWISAKLSTLSQSVAVDLVRGHGLAGIRLDPRAAAASRSAPSMSCSGQRVIRSCDVLAASAARRALSAVTSSRTTSVETVALRRVEVRVVEHVERGLHAGERRPARLGVLEQLPVAPRMRLVVVGDVVEQQDEPRSSRPVRRGRAHGREAHPQQMAGGRAGHEARRRGRWSPPRAMRCSTVSSAWAISARSITPWIERPSPISSAPPPPGARESRRNSCRARSL